ncbi:hypothetical protein, partial [Pseudomonas aeruginosa]|uniref:hypothetical protein n=1 Tax=Pseudomonas aeruginosa TaxID=287 RepID=UPI001C52872E
IYYFFVGKKIAEGYSERQEIRGKVQDLLKDLHREDFVKYINIYYSPYKRKLGPKQHKGGTLISIP